MLTALTFAVCPFLTPVIAIEKELVFAPAKESSVRKHFEESTNWRLVELTQVNSVAPIRIDDAVMNGETTRTIVVLDTYQEPGDSKPKRLRRTFEELGGKQSFDFDIQGASDSLPMTLSHPLAEKSVEFVRLDDAESAKVQFAEDSGGDATALEGLAEDLDLRTFLPAEDVGVEDWWEVDASVLGRVLAPGGVRLGLSDGALPSSEFLDPLELASTVLCVLSENTAELSGDVTATWTETSKREGDEAAQIAIEWKSSSQTTLDERLNDLLRQCGADTQRTKATMSMSVACEGAGTLDWSLTAKRANAFELSLKTEYSAELFWNEGGQRIGYRFRFEGQSKLTAEFEAP